MFFTSSVANTMLMYFIIVLAEISVFSLKSNLRMIQSVVTVSLLTKVHKFLYICLTHPQYHVQSKMSIKAWISETCKFVDFKGTTDLWYAYKVKNQTACDLGIKNIGIIVSENFRMLQNLT